MVETPSRRALLYLRFREKAAEDGPEQLLRATRRGNNRLARRRYQHIRETDAELRPEFGDPRPVFEVRNVLTRFSCSRRRVSVG